MLLHPDLFSCRHTTYMTSLRIQFNFLLTEVAAWDGLITLSVRELANELNCSTDSVVRLISEAISEGFLERDPLGRLMLQKYVEYKEEKTERYIRHFSFIRSKEFQKEPAPVQRFILHVIETSLNWGRAFTKYLKDLYNRYRRVPGGKEISSIGLFNIPYKKEMMQIIDRASKYLDIKISHDTKGDFVQVFRIKPEYAGENKETMIIANRGKELWIQKTLEKYRYISGLISRDKIIKLSIVMDEYVEKMGFSVAEDLFCQTLVALEDQSKFHSLLYYEDPEELRKYFKTVMSEVDKSYGENLLQQLSHMEEVEVTTRSTDTFKELRKSFYRIKSNIEQKIKRFEDLWITRLQFEFEEVVPYWLSDRKRTAFLRYMPGYHQILQHAKIAGL